MSFLSLLNRCRRWREQGWTPISAADYGAAWQRWGGSVITHPEIVHALSTLADARVDYLGWHENGVLHAALPAWGRHLALSRAALKERRQRHLFDLGNAEVILPQAPVTRIVLRHQLRYLSAMHAPRTGGIRPQRETLALARAPEHYSRKFRYNLRRERRLLEERGGSIRPIASLSPQQLASIYEHLFELRWGFDVPGKARLSEVFSLLQPFMTGSYIHCEDRPVAVQILYRVESPTWFSVEYVNGGVDPAWQPFSPGSVLSFVNTSAEWEYARARDKALRYSFGRMDTRYKDRWCEAVEVYESR